MYHSPEEKEKKFDLVAEPTADSPDDRRKIVEVETSPEKKRHVVDDSIKLAQEYGDAIWVVKDLDGMRKLLSSLTDQIGYVEATSTTNFEKTSEMLDEDGIQEVYGINKLRDELDEM
jgi:hypothetical protein